MSIALYYCCRISDKLKFPMSFVYLWEFIDGNWKCNQSAKNSHTFDNGLRKTVIRERQRRPYK